MTQHDNEKRLSLIYNNTNDSMVLWRIEGDDLILESFNNSFTKLAKTLKYNFNHDKIVGVNSEVFFKEIAGYSDEEFQFVQSNLINIVKSKEQVQYIEETNHPVGVKYLDNTIIPILDDKTKECTHILYIGRDVSTQKEAEKALMDSEERLSLIYNSAADMMGLVEVKGEREFVFVSTNKQGELSNKRNGIKDDDYYNVSLKDFAEKTLKLGKEAVEGLVDMYQKVAETQENVTIDNKIDLKESGFTYIETTLNPVINKEGKCTHILWCSRDVTESTLTANFIRENEERLSLIYNSTTDRMGLVEYKGERDFVFVSANRKTKEFHEASGISDKDFFNVSLYDYGIKSIGLSSEEAKGLVDLYQNIASGKEGVTIENEILMPNGDKSYAETDLSPVLDNEGNCTHILFCTRDISDKKEAERKLRESYEEVSQLKKQLEQENIYLQEEIKLENNFENMVYASDAFRKVLNNIEQVAPLNVTVLITGESGTGKELIARAVHNLSDRAKRPMIKLNCGALPKDLVESELFGHEKGAFTGAIDQKLGKFELADKSTIFLDEMGEMPLDAQVKLLRVIQEGEFERIGGTKTIKVDVRVIAATNRNLEKEIEEGNFRQDLFYRLNVFPIALPPLRDRVEDIAPMTEFFIRKFSKQYNKTIEFVTQDALDALQNYNWPGNVRELENLIERAVVIANDDVLQFPELQTLGRSEKKRNAKSLTLQTLSEVERRHILNVLKNTNWVIGGTEGAANILGLKPSTLRDRMKKLDIQRSIKL